MAKKQTRRSISIRGSTYDQVRAYTERNGMSMSEFVEDRIAKFFSTGRPERVRVEEAPRPVKIAPKPKKRSAGGKDLDNDELHTAARHFTF